MMSRLRDDSQRTAAEIEQQLKDNEACGYEKGAMGILSQAPLPQAA